MEACRICGAETQLYVNGAPICISCNDKGPERNYERASASLREAREAYSIATAAQREAMELSKSLDVDNPDGSTALANVNREVALASAKYEKALREFLAATAVRPRSA